MKKSDFKHLLQSVREMKAVMQGRLKPARTMTFTERELKAMRTYRGAGLSPAFMAARVRSIRQRLGLSQGDFAALLRVPKATLCNWEQGRRKPEGPALSLLLVADRAPEAVLHALHGPKAAS